MGLVDAIEPRRSPVSRPSGRASRRGSLVALAVVAALLGDSGGASEAPVYGCALRQADEGSEDEG